MSLLNDSPCCKEKFFASHESPLFRNVRPWFKLLAIDFFCGFLHFHVHPMARSLQASFFLLQAMHYPHSVTGPISYARNLVFLPLGTLLPIVKTSVPILYSMNHLSRWSYVFLPLFLQNFPHLESIHRTTWFPLLPVFCSIFLSCLRIPSQKTRLCYNDRAMSLGTLAQFPALLFLKKQEWHLEIRMYRAVAWVGVCQSGGLAFNYYLRIVRAGFSFFFFKSSCRTMNYLCTLHPQHIYLTNLCGIIAKWNW